MQFYQLQIYLQMKLKTQIELYFAQQNESQRIFYESTYTLVYTFSDHIHFQL